MAQLCLSIDCEVDIPNSKVTAKLKRVANSVGTDLTSDFLSFCNTHSLSLDTQQEIEAASFEYAKAPSNQSKLP